MEQKSAASSFVFRWRYIALPAGILALSLVLVIFFYFRLPQEVALRFDSDGSPVNRTGRGALVFGALLLQSLFALAAFSLTRVMTAVLNRYTEPGVTAIRPEQVVMVMGNMVALPQAIILFAMLDIFSYNSFQIHLIPIWVFGIIVAVLGGIALGVFVVRTLRMANKERSID